MMMQRSAPWLRLVNAAEVGDEAYFQQILKSHPQVVKKLSLNVRRIIGVATRSNTRALQWLLAAGWPADPAMENRQTALHFAAWHGNVEMVRALLAHKAPVNVFETEHGGSPLGWALHGSLHSWMREKGDYPAVARALLGAGAEIPRPERPLEATEEVLEIIRQHKPKIPGKT